MQTFVNKCLRIGLQIYCLNNISNEDPWQTTEQEKIELWIKRRRWSWLGTFCTNQIRTQHHQAALRWNPREQQKKRLRNSWRRSVEWTMREAGLKCLQLDKQFSASFSCSQNSIPSEIISSNLYTENYVAVRPAACNFSGISFVWFSKLHIRL